MIIYDRLWRFMAEKGVSTYALRETYGIDPKTIQKLQRNQNITAKTMSRLCKILDCKLEDIAEYIPDESEK